MIRGSHIYTCAAILTLRKIQLQFRNVPTDKIISALGTRALLIDFIDLLCQVFLLNLMAKMPLSKPVLETRRQIMGPWIIFNQALGILVDQF